MRKDNGGRQIIGPGSDMRQVVSEVHEEMETINPHFLVIVKKKEA